MKIYRKILLSFFLCSYILALNCTCIHFFNKNVTFRKVRSPFKFSILKKSDNYNYLIEKFGSEKKVIKAIKQEAGSTSRTFMEILKGCCSPSNIEVNEHEYVMIGGGSGTHAFVNGYKEVTDELSVGLVPTVHDDGGDTLRVREAIRHYFEKHYEDFDKNKWLFAVGDLAYMMLGLTSDFKKDILSARLPRLKSSPSIKNSTLTQGVTSLLRQQERKASSMNKSLPADWLFFSNSLLNLARIYDEKMSDILGLDNASIKNRIFVGQLLKSDFLDLDNHEIKEENLPSAVKSFSEILGLKKSYVYPGSLDEAVLVASCKDKKGNEFEIIRQTEISDTPKGEIKEISFKIKDRENYRGIKEHEWPTITSGAKKIIKKVNGAIVVGPGSVASSLLPNLLLKGKKEESSLVEVVKKQRNVPRVLIMNPYYDNETLGLQPMDIINLFQRSIRNALGKKVKIFGEKGVFSHVLIPTPESIKENKTQLDEIASVGLMKKDQIKKVFSSGDYKKLMTVEEEIFDDKGTLKGSKIPRGLLLGDESTRDYLESRGTTVIPIGEYEKVENSKVRFINPDNGETITLDLPVVRYNMKRLVEEIIRPL